MSVDWVAVEQQLRTEIVDAVSAARRREGGAVPSRVEIVDVHVQDMLVLWPTIVVHHADPLRSPVVVEGSRRGDLWAAQVTGLGGPGGIRWEEVFARYHGVIATACAQAARRIGLPVAVGGDQTPAASAAAAAVIDEHVPCHGPLDYRGLCEVLAGSPHLDAALAASLSVDTVRPVNARDVPTAVEALSSPWEAVRRHAAIVLLSVHL